MASLIGGIAGGLIQGRAAKKATKAQVAAANQQLALEREIFDYTKGIQKPFVDAGTLANKIIQYELFGGPAPVISQAGFNVGGTQYGTREEAQNALAAATERFNTGSQVRTPVYDSRLDREFPMDIAQSAGRMNYQTQFDPNAGISAAGFDPRGASVSEVDPVTYGGFQKTPDYKFAFDEGRNAVESSRSSTGLKNGATLKALTEYGQNFASLRRDNYMNQLFRLTGSGQAGTNALQQAGQAFSAGSGSALSAIGNAQSAGAIARGNAFNSMVQGGIQGISNIFSGGFGGIGQQLFGGLGSFGGAGGGGRAFF